MRGRHKTPEMQDRQMTTRQAWWRAGTFAAAAILGAGLALAQTDEASPPSVSADAQISRHQGEAQVVHGVAEVGEQINAEDQQQRRTEQHHLGVTEPEAGGLWVRADALQYIVQGPGKGAQDHQAQACADQQFKGQ